MLVMIVDSAINRISGCTVVHRLVPCGGVLFQMSRSCGLLGRKLGCTLEKFDLGTSFQEVAISLLFVPYIKASWRSLMKSFHTVELGLAWLG
jgi:hypothetical protein